jgi:hypothetical protein
MDDAWALLDGLPDGRGYNIAHEAVDRHAQGARAGKTAIRWLGKDGERRELTYGDLAAATNRFANALTDLGVQPGERVFVLMGRTPELYVAVLGALKARCVVSPLFSAFGPEPIATRLEMGDGRVLVTTPGLYRRKIEACARAFPDSGTSLWWAPKRTGQKACTAGTRWWTPPRPTSRSNRPIRKRRRCCISPAARPGGPRAQFMCMVPWSRTTSPASMPSICMRTTCSGARPIPAGSPAPATASSRR